MPAPLFSIIIPVYNAESFLDECVGSVLAQEHGDCELLLMDDGSTDRSGQICDDYASRFPQAVRAFHQENAGLLLTRRRALLRASGEYIMFLDSDDMLSPDALGELRGAVERTGADIVIYHLTRVDAGGALTGDAPLPFFTAEGYVSRDDVLRRLTYREALNSLCVKLIRRTLFDMETDYTPYAHITNGEDLLQSIPVVMNAERIYYLPKPLYLYRINGASMTNASYRGNFAYLTVVKPRLLQALRSYGLDSTRELTDFYGLITERLLPLLNAAANAPRDNELFRMLTELADAPVIRGAARYLRGLPISAFRRLVLRLYCAGRVRAALRLMRIRNRMVG